jgi:hypothetical protein
VHCYQDAEVQSGTYFEARLRGWGLAEGRLVARVLEDWKGGLLEQDSE